MRRFLPLALVAALCMGSDPYAAPTGALALIGDSLTADGIISDVLLRRLPWVTDVGGYATPWGRDSIGIAGHSGLRFWDYSQGFAPFCDGAGPACEMTTYMAANGGTPDLAVISLGINQLFTSPDATVLGERITAELGYIDGMIVALKAMNPSVKIVITSPPPSNPSTAAWENAFDPPYDDRDRWEGYRATANAAWSSQYSGRTAELIWYLEFTGLLEPHYPALDPIHPNAVGYEIMALQLAPIIYTVASQ